MWSHRFFQSQGRRVMELLSTPSEDLNPQVVTGKRSGAHALASNLTLGIALRRTCTDVVRVPPI
jgi:hypothetical protein